MNNNNISQITDQQTMTSLDIAQITGKEHKHILRDIRNMEPAWENVTGTKFGLSKYKDGSGKSNPCYILNKRETLFVATKFNDEARAKLVLRWEELEKERLMNVQASAPVQTDFQAGQCPANYPVDPRNMSRLQILQIALQAEEEKEQLRAEKEELELSQHALMIENGEKDHQIQQLQQQTAYLNVIMTDVSTVTVSQIAQDYGLSAVAFNKLLNGLRIQRAVGGQWILYSEFLNCGYVANRMIPIHHAGRPDTHKPMTVWTQAGRKFLYDRLKKHGVIPLIERNALDNQKRTTN